MTRASETRSVGVIWSAPAALGDCQETKIEVVEITGAAFGEYCNLHLKNRCLMVSDPARN